MIALVFQNLPDRLGPLLRMQLKVNAQIVTAQAVLHLGIGRMSLGCEDRRGHITKHVVAEDGRETRIASRYLVSNTPKPRKREGKDQKGTQVS
jgi:hypothetical protein